MVAAPGKSPNSRPRWWQFSLATLLLLAVLACVAAAYFGAERRRREASQQVAAAAKQIQELQEANIQFKRERGVLTVTDESKIHLEYRGKSLDPELMRWKWRIYVPQRAQSRFVVEAGAIENSGFNHPPGKKCEALIWGYSGQHNVEVTIQRDLDSQPILILRIGVPGEKGLRVPLSEAEFESIRRLDHPRKSQPRGRPRIAADSNSRVELIRIASKELEIERTGLVIYFERVSPVP